MTQDQIAPALFETASRTDRGCVRTHNEDACLTLPDEGVWVVSDGMGGHAAGDVASALIIEEMSLLGATVSAEDQRARLCERLARAHQRIRAHAQAHGLEAMGATVAILAIHEDELTCLWAGDSRIYLLRDEQLTRLTTDHSRVAQMVADGLMTEAEARHAPGRNVITRAVGVGSEVKPELATGPVRGGDVFLLCSDGLTEHLDDTEIATMLACRNPVDVIAATLIDTVLERGARDNVTAVVIRAPDLPEPDPEAEA